MTLLTPELRLPPGGSGEIAVRLGNATASQIRGEAQLVSPFGSWAQTRPWTQGFTAGPAGDVTLAFGVAVPGHGAARPALVGAGQGHVLRAGPLQRARGDLGER